MSSTAILASMLTLAMAQTTTLQIPFYGYDTFAIDASIIAVQDSVTTMSLACPPDAEECGLFPQQTLTYGPSTYRMEMGTGDAEFTGSQICQAEVCTESAGGSGANFPGSSTTTYDGVESMPVTVTAGVALLGGGAGATTGSTSGSGSATTTSGESGTMQATETASTSETGSASITQSGAAETSSSASAVSVVAKGGMMGGVVAVIALFL